MRKAYFASKIFLLIFLFNVGGCTEEPVEDACLKSKWPQVKQYEIKLAVNVLETNPSLPGGTNGSQYPSDFDKMTVGGTIEKVDCYDQKSGLNNLGNSYIDKSKDLPAPIDVPDAWWIGYIVYVYEFSNDEDLLDVNLTVKITMKDNQSYSCNILKKIYYPQIVKVPGEMYYYILLDIYSENWIKV